MSRLEYGTKSGAGRTPFAPVAANKWTWNRTSVRIAGTEYESTVKHQKMKAKTVRLDDEVKSVLLRSAIDGCNLTLPGQLERGLYQRVAKAIEAAGGKWNRKAQCHIFPNDVCKTMNLTEESVEVVNLKQTYQAFYTPGPLASKVAKMADLIAGDTILEPSAGNGNLIRAAISQGVFQSDVVAVEIDPEKAKALKYRTICADFMTCNGELGTFDKILMNPPFTGGQDIAHIQHAMGMLNPGGKLVAICANGHKQKEILKPLCSHWEDLPAGSFVESGTNVNAALVIIEKPLTPASA